MARTWRRVAHQSQATHHRRWLKMTIVPHTGYGEVLLGSSRSKVVEHLGEPSERRTESYGNESDIEYFEYSTPNITLGFDREDGDRLGTITIRDEKAILNGRRVIGRRIENVIRENQAIKLDDDFEEFGIDYVDKVKDLSFWVNDTKVTSVTVFPGWVDDNTPRWPTIGAESQPQR